jgi:hypothetical protein
MREVRRALDEQAHLLHPVKPRVLFNAVGERHAEQSARLAEESRVPSAHLHHSMTDTRIRAVRERFENDSGDLQGIVQLKMLGQQQESKALTRVRSQIRVPAISSGRAGTACRFNGYDERCRRSLAFTSSGVGRVPKSIVSSLAFRSARCDNIRSIPVRSPKLYSLEYVERLYEKSLEQRLGRSFSGATR